MVIHILQMKDRGSKVLSNLPKVTKLVDSAEFRPGALRSRSVFLATADPSTIIPNRTCFSFQAFLGM